MRFNYLVKGSRGFVQDSGNYGIQTVIDSTISQGYSVITTADELENIQALKSIGANETNATNVLGLFAPGNMNMS
jgi:alkaline phosphatase